MDNGMVACLSLKGQAMNTPVLTIDERQNIDSGPWFSKLSQTLRHAILARREQAGPSFATTEIEHRIPGADGESTQKLAAVIEIPASLHGINQAAGS